MRARKMETCESAYVDFKTVLFRTSLGTWRADTLSREMYIRIKVQNSSQIIQEESKNGKTITYGAVHMENRKYSPLGRNIEDY